MSKRPLLAESDSDASAILTRIAALDAEKAALEAQLRRLRAQGVSAHEAPPSAGTVTHFSDPSAKIALFRSLFRGREDVFPRRWVSVKTKKTGFSPACFNDWKRGVCGKPDIKCRDCTNQAYIPVSDEVIKSHLLGGHTIGVYPMLPDDTCWFLAADFDKRTWQSDCEAFWASCRKRGVFAAMERSRSGNGGHVWIFFSEPVPASLARRLGSHLLTEAMEAHPDIGLRSYDRFFPSQDTVPMGGFGNLIALPLQHGPRKNGNSVFLDESFNPYPDQWAFLASVRRLPKAQAAAITDEASRQGRVIGLRLPVRDEDEQPWTAPPSGQVPSKAIPGPLPERVDAVLGDQLYISRNELPPALVNRLVRLAAFQNPQFYRAQAARRWTGGLPRIVACAELLSHHVALPRGCRSKVEHLLAELGIRFDLRDERLSGRHIDARFLGTLRPEQERAAEALLAHDCGVLAAGTAFGKTVVAAWLIAARKVNTLVVVHRRPLLDQWIARIGAFLDLCGAPVGQIGGGKKRPGGIVDVALVQSLVRRSQVDDLVADYGQVVFDECHHLSAVSFEQVARRVKGRYVLGLSASVTRRDGHHPVFLMQCGPVRYRTNPKALALQRPFAHRAVLRPTAFECGPAASGEELSIQRIYTQLADDKDRSRQIVDDVLLAVEASRSPIVLTERRAHAELLAASLARNCPNVVLLRGGMGAKQRAAVSRRLSEIPDSEKRVLVATGRYVGEGFDDARLDTLFLAMPIAWKGTLQQYVGRLHRLHPEKREARVYDYVDEGVAVLMRMSEKRIRGYRALGYTVERVGGQLMPDGEADRDRLSD